MSQVAKFAYTLFVWTATGAVIFFISSVAVFFANGEAVWFFGNPFNPLVHFFFIALGVLVLTITICTGIALHILDYYKKESLSHWKNTLSLLLIAIPAFIIISTLLGFSDLYSVF